MSRARRSHREDPALAGLAPEAVFERLARFEAGPGGGVPRWQDPIIRREIPQGASVLDLGCGTGELLAGLIQDKRVRGQGIELDPEAVYECVRRGVPVIQSDLDAGLQGFADASFDFVVLEETLQTLHHPLRVLEEMLRVGRHGMVSFPNFGWGGVRRSLSLEGRMPVTHRLPYHWHDTPNIHLLTLQDFLDWAAPARVSVARGFALAGGEVRPLGAGDNFEAEEVLLFITRTA